MSAINQHKVSCVTTNPAIYSADFMAALVKQYEAMLAKHQGTITEANAEIDRLKNERPAMKEVTRVATVARVCELGRDPVPRGRQGRPLVNDDDRPEYMDVRPDYGDSDDKGVKVEPFSIFEDCDGIRYLYDTDKDLDSGAVLYDMTSQLPVGVFCMSKHESHVRPYDASKYEEIKIKNT